MKLLGFYGETPYLIEVPNGIVDTCERVPLGDTLRCAIVLNDEKPIHTASNASNKQVSKDAS